MHNWAVNETFTEGWALAGQSTNYKRIGVASIILICAHPSAVVHPAPLQAPNHTPHDHFVWAPSFLLRSAR